MGLQLTTPSLVMELISGDQRAIISSNCFFEESDFFSISILTVFLDFQFMKMIFLAMHRAVGTLGDVFVSISNSLVSPKMHSLDEHVIQKLNHMDRSSHITCQYPWTGIQGAYSSQRIACAVGAHV